MAFQVQLPLGWNTYMLFNTDIMNYVWKTDEVEAESIVLLIFVLWRCLNLRWMKSGGMGQKVYLEPAEITPFSCWPFSHLNQIWFKCETPLLFFLMFYYISFDQQLSADVLQNRYSGKHMCWSLFLIKLHALRPATLLKRDSKTGVLLWN